MKRIIYVVFICATMLLTSSCYDSTEVDDMIYILAIGIDNAENNTYEYTFQSAVPLNISSGVETGFASSEDSTTLQNIKVSAPNLYSAIDTVNQKVTKEINIAHCKLIVFSEELAKNNLKNHINAVIQNPSIRPQVFVAVTNTLAQDYLNSISSPFELNPARYYESFFGKDYSPQSFTANLNDFEKAETVVVPLIGKDNKITTSIIKDYTQIGTLDSDQTVVLNILTGQYNNGHLTVNRDMPAINLSQDKMPDIAVDTSGNVLKIRFDLSFYGTPTALIENKNEYDKTIKKYIEKSCTDLLNKSSKVLNADIVNISAVAKRNFSTTVDFEKYNWNEKYSEAVFFVNVSYRTIR